jgi:hypothetical protein
VLARVRYVARVARLIAANSRDAAKIGSWQGRQALRGGFEGLGWFLIGATPIIVGLQATGVLKGPKPTASDLIWVVGVVLGGILLVVFIRRLPQKELGLRHVILSERDDRRRYVPICSCGWIGEPQGTVEGLLLAGRDHENQSALEPRTAE